MTARVVAVAPGSPAAVVGVRPGDELLTVNGEAVRDVIRYQLQADEPHVELELRRGGLEQTARVDKRAGEPLGLELATAVFDRVRTCDNHCPFCFIYQLPPGMRRSLAVKDDDYRLSFLYGNFTTLTRFTESDLERVVSERLSPLYVSIHATDPDLRARLLRNRRGATSLRWLGALLDAGIEVHGQIVVCPGLNDGAALDDTLLGVLDRFPGLRSLGVVPLGVSAHSREPDLRPHTRAQARAVLDTVGEWQERFLAALGRRLVFASDEYFLLAGWPFPAVGTYGALEQHENGVGMAASFLDEVARAARGEVVDGVGLRPGFFAWVDGAPAEGYRAPHDAPVALRPRAEVMSSRRVPVTILTGRYGAAVLRLARDDLRAVAGASPRILPVDNTFFGGNIAVTGLLTGADLVRVLDEEPPVGRRRYLLPDVALSRGVFLDGLTPADLPRPVEVIPTNGAALVEALRAPARVPVAIGGSSR